MKELDITQWTKVGEGGNGATYINPAEPGVLLKESYLELAKADDLVQEFNVSKAIYELGVSTPRMIELVSVNGRAAIKCQAIEGKKSFAKLCHDNPEHLDDYAISRLMQMEEAQKNDPWKEEDGNLIGASELG